MRITIVRNLLMLSLIGDILFFIFPFPAAFWRTLILLLSIYIIAKYKKGSFDAFQKSCIFFLIVNIVYVLFAFISGPQPITNIVNLLVSLGGLIAFSILGENGALDEKYVIRLVAILLVLCSFRFYYMENYMSERLNVDKITNNSSVLFLWLLPLALAFRKRIISLIIAGVCIFFLILGAKRGNIVAAVPTILIYFYSISKQKNVKLSKKALQIFGLVVVVFLAVQWILSNDYFQFRWAQTMEGDSSNRDELYSTFWNMWVNSGSFIHTFFGWGYNGTNITNNSMAHSDWLEFLVDYGFVGVVSYAAMIIAIIMKFIRANRKEIKVLLFSLISIWLVKSFVSMCVIDELMIILGLTYGYVSQLQCEKHVELMK